MPFSDGNTWSWLGGTFAAFVTGVLGIIAGSKRARADVTSVITEGFERLVRQLQEERKHDRLLIQSLETEARGLRAEVTALRVHIALLEAHLRQGGLPVPEQQD